MRLTRGGALALASALALAAAMYWLREPVAAALLSLVEVVEGLGGWGPAAFVGLMTAAIPLGIPAGPLLLAAGVLFGAVGGIVYATAGNLLGGALAFLLGRRLMRGPIERHLEGEKGFEVLNRALREEGMRSVALIRVSPALPAWLINYALGVSDVSWRDYWLSAFSILPTVALYALSGAGLGDLAALQGGSGPEKGPAYWALLVGGILTTLAATLLLGLRARRILETEGD